MTNPRGGTTSRGAARRDSIVDAAVRLWAKKGYDATGIADICREADIGKGALYHHVGSKEDILFKYISSVYFGDRAYGAGAAAQTYFRKPVMTTKTRITRDPPSPG